jgi:hypothetical protein
MGSVDSDWKLSQAINKHDDAQMSKPRPNESRRACQVGVIKWYIHMYIPYMYSDITLALLPLVLAIHVPTTQPCLLMSREMVMLIPPTTLTRPFTMRPL